MMMMMSSIDTEMAVDGGILELENDSLSSPLLLHGGECINLQSTWPQQQQQQWSSLLEPQTTIDQSTQSDGSIAVKASTVTTHTNGYRDVKIEHFHIPACQAAVEVSKRLRDDTTPPSSSYRTRVEYRVEPPEDDDVSTVYTYFSPTDNASVASSPRRKKLGKRKSRISPVMMVVVGVALFFVAIVGVALVRDDSQGVESPDSSSNTDNNIVPADDASDVVPVDDATAGNGTSAAADVIDEDGTDGTENGSKPVKLYDYRTVADLVRGWGGV